MEPEQLSASLHFSKKTVPGYIIWNWEFIIKMFQGEKTHYWGELISFTREKKNGDLRITLNLEEFNEYFEYLHFMMDSMEKILEIVSKDCFMPSTDFKDAYFVWDFYSMRPEKIS